MSQESQEMVTVLVAKDAAEHAFAESVLREAGLLPACDRSLPNREREMRLARHRHQDQV